MSVTDTDSLTGCKVNSRNDSENGSGVTATESARATLVKNRNDKQLFRELRESAIEEARRALQEASQVVDRQRAAGEFSDPREGFWRMIEIAVESKPPEEKEALRLAQEARKTADVCGRCGRGIQGGETVYWDVGVYVGIALLFGVGPKYFKTVVCEGCAPEYRVREAKAKGEPMELPGGHLSYLSRFHDLPCGTCDRRVVVKKSRRDYHRPMAPIPDRPGRAQLAAFCCERCRWTFYNGKRKERSAREREKACEVCGEAFTPARSDAKTCSSACKQKAYRARKKGGAA